MSTVDEILASGQYRDRRGRRWEHQASLNWDEVAEFYRTEEIGWCRMRGLSLVGEIITHPQMRLLIERDQHRGECEGLDRCYRHPVWIVSQGFNEDGYAAWEILRPYANQGRLLDTTHAEAMDVARALAVTP